MTAAYSSAQSVLARDAGSRAGSAAAGTVEHGHTAAAHEAIVADICVIGAGAGGLTVALGAAAVGQRVVLIEKHRMGGDSLNYACVPSKALLATARRAHDIRLGGAFGLEPFEPNIDFGALRHHILGTVSSIAPNCSVERFSALGVRVVQAGARFIDKSTVEAGDLHVKARRFVIATGSSPEIPQIPGLDGVAYFTNATIFDNSRKLDRLIIIGGGPAALELAQAYGRLGSTVSVLAAGPALEEEDPELSAIALQALRREGVAVYENTTVDRIAPTRGGVRVTATGGGATGDLDGSHLLIITRRKANIGDLNLSAAGIKASANGITVNAALRTSNRRVYAIGDVTGSAAGAHLAEYQAGIFLKRVLFRLRAREARTLVPRVTFTAPEIAWVGLDEAAARAKHGRVKVLRFPYGETSRAQAERITEGHVKVIIDARGQILGAGIVGAQASELIQVWALAISQNLSIRAMTDWVAPHPTLSEINRRVAFGSFATAAGRPFTRWLVRLLGRFG